MEPGLAHAIELAVKAGVLQEAPQVKTTRYFEHVRKRPDRAAIREEWISQVMDQPEKPQVQSDGLARGRLHRERRVL